MTTLADMQLIATEAVDSLRELTGRLEKRLGREPTLTEVAQALALAYGAARGALQMATPTEDLAALGQFVEVAADDARFCLMGLREAGL
ncbi:hypothetical protein [Paracoccus sanguinis]|uniref:Uncharacterized protein n=1 Tax=Paracoccus sanguinis TaxID=1545044 RepID=A0A1H2SMU4_9RHOB|nr:hypothetical protein [Paracoccus sanguinis]KGJ19334.1 hypothetical protein IX57_00290 [Paracoccus sanguinis]SDW32956.1 hypothetical protein SAMN05444276_101677 [Paracoccus sanguinis]